MSELTDTYFRDSDPEDFLTGMDAIRFDREEEAKRELLNELEDIYNEVDNARTRMSFLYDDRKVPWSSYAKISDYLLKAQNAIERLR